MDEEDSKPPASSSTTPPRDDDDCDDAPIAQQKRRKDNSGRAVVEKDGGGEEDAEVYDVAEVQGFRPGDRFEVKWTIFGDNEDAAAADRIGGGGREAKEEVDGSAVEDHDGGGGDAVDGEDGGVTVWWAATLVQKTDRMHDLADDERGEGTTSVDDEDSPLRRRSAAKSARIPGTSRRTLAISVALMAAGRRCSAAASRGSSSSPRGRTSPGTRSLFFAKGNPVLDHLVD